MRLNNLSNIFRLIILLFLTLVNSACADKAAKNDKQVSLEVARQLLDSKQALVFDIREAKEHKEGVVKGMKLLPMSVLPQRVNEIPKDQPVLLICNTQNRSERAMLKLKKSGWENIRFVNLGMSGWEEKKWPTSKPNCVLNDQRKLICFEI